MSRPNEVHSLCFDLVLPTLPRSIDEDHHPPEDQPASADPRCDGTPLLEDIAQPRRAREIQVRCAVHGKRRSRRNMVELVEGSGRWSCVEGRQCQLKHRSTVAETGNIFTEPKEPQETVSHTDSIYQHALQQQQQQQHTFQQQQSFQFHQQAQQHFALHQNEVLASAPFFQSVPLVIHQQHHDQQPHDFHSGFMAAASGVGICSSLLSPAPSSRLYRATIGAIRAILVWTPDAALSSSSNGLPIATTSKQLSAHRTTVRPHVGDG